MIEVDTCDFFRFLRFAHKKRSPGVVKESLGIFEVFGVDLKKELVAAPDSHHRSGNAGGVLVRGKALDAGGFQPGPGEQIFLLVL
jgi:hypothetical protein